MLYRVIEILDNILGPHRLFAKSEYYYYCPFCHHYNPKLAVNLTKKKWHCWKCGARGSTLLSLLRKLSVSKDQINELAQLLDEELPKVKHDTDTQVILTLPSEFVPLYQIRKTFTANNAYAYLLRRGFTDADILKHRIGYCEEGLYANRVIIPSYDETGKLNFFVGRDIYDNSFMAYRNPPVSKNIVGFGNLINWDYPIILTEGVFDAMAIKRNAIPLFGKTLPRKIQERIIQEGVTDVYLALDNDALKETLQLAEKLVKQGIRVYVVELSGKDPASLGFENIQNLIDKSTPLTFLELMQLKLKLV